MSEHTLDSPSKLEEKLFLLGRILMSILFFVPAYRKASSIDGTIAYFGKLGLPFPEITVYVVVAFEFIVAICFLLGWRIKLVAYLMAAFSIAAGLIAHQFWSVDPAQLGNQLNHLLKNGAVAGGFIMAALLADRFSNAPAEEHTD